MLGVLGLVLTAFTFEVDALAGKITGGERQSCAISATGAVTCWGQRSTGSLGDGGPVKGMSDKPVQVVGIKSGATDVAGTSTGNGGSQYACAVVSGSVKCWGTGGYGTLGNGLKTSSNVPVQVTGLTSGVTGVSLNATHACAVQSGAVWCWGSGYLGGAAKTSPVPVQVLGLAAGATAVAVGWRHACALVAGAVSCWVGKGAEPVPGLAGVTSIAAGLDFTCAIAGGAVSCWGRSSLSGRSATPVPVAGLESGVTAIAANWGHVCAIKSGTVWCWGVNSSGQLGNGAKIVPGYGAPTSLVPVAVKGPKGVTAIGVGRSHSCAIAAGGVRWCWGSNSGGQLGNSAVKGSTSVAVKVTGK